jgi:hypothetical protein
VTHELWFTDNGRDMLGDDVPGDELNWRGRPGAARCGTFAFTGRTSERTLRRTASEGTRRLIASARPASARARKVGSVTLPAIS